jgi:hypothetical protein
MERPGYFVGRPHLFLLTLASHPQVVSTRPPEEARRACSRGPASFCSNINVLGWGAMDSEQQQRWSDSRARLHQARMARRAGRLDEAFAFYTQAHNLGDDHVRCHIRGHLGRARIELRRGDFRDASIDTFWASTAVMISTIRRILGRRGAGIAMRMPTT